MIGVLIRRPFEDIDIHTGRSSYEGSVRDQREESIRQRISRIAGIHQKLVEARKNSSLYIQREHSPADILISDF